MVDKITNIIMTFLFAISTLCVGCIAYVELTGPVYERPGKQCTTVEQFYLKGDLHHSIEQSGTIENGKCIVKTQINKEPRIMK